MVGKMRRIFLVPLFYIFATTTAMAGEPVIVGGHADLDPCGYGVIAGSTANVAVRNGPSSSAAKIEDLPRGVSVWGCDFKNGWHGIVYSRSGQDCRLSSPIPIARSYRGACKSGWIPKEAYRLLAG